MSAWLTATIDGEMQRWAVAKDEFVIGRDESADLTIPATFISRYHSRITKGQINYYVADLGSRNGTFLNGAAVAAEPQRLRTGDEIVLAGAISLHFEDPTETPVGPRIGRIRGIWIDPEREMVWVDALAVEPPLSRAQLLLLQVLYNRPNQIVTRDVIIAEVWPDVDSAGVSVEAVDGLYKRLRRRLRATQPKNDYVETVRSHGFRLNR